MSIALQFINSFFDFDLFRMNSSSIDCFCWMCFLKWIFHILELGFFGVFSVLSVLLVFSLLFSTWRFLLTLFLICSPLFHPIFWQSRTESPIGCSKFPPTRSKNSAYCKTISYTRGKLGLKTWSNTISRNLHRLKLCIGHNPRQSLVVNLQSPLPNTEILM